MFPEIKPGHWHRVPNSRLRAVARSPLPPGTSGFGVLAESGGALDTRRRRLVVWGGGHADYSGNEIYAFSLDTLTWSMIWPGTPIEQIPTGAANYNTYPDGNPSSRHTRDGLDYLPVLDQFLSCGGSVWKNGGNDRATWVFDFATDKWIKKTSPPDTQYTNVYSAYDPASGKVFVIRPQAADRSGTLVYSYDPVTNSWQRLNKSPYYGHRRTAAYDPNSKKLLLGGMGQIVAWDMNRPSAPGVTLHSGLGGVLGRPGWGLEYDHNLDRFVVWAQGAQIFYIHPETVEIVEHALPKDSPAVPDTKGGGNTGPHGRFRVDPASGCYVAVNSVSDDVYLFRPSLSNTKPLPGPGKINDSPPERR
jgi:hypothetical protein